MSPADAVLSTQTEDEAFLARLGDRVASGGTAAG